VGTGLVRDFFDYADAGGISKQVGRMTIRDLLRLAQIDPLEARILMAHALKCSRVQLVIRENDALSVEQINDFKALLNRRMQGEPIAYLTGEREFYGLRFKVTPDVLIPRPETELLVELAMEKLPQAGRVGDLGTGSGAVAVALAHTRRDAQVIATDISDEALAVAHHNADHHEVKIQFIRSDWFEMLDGLFDLLVSNPPYIAASDVHLLQGDLRFEPCSALTDHANGMTALSTIIEGAPAHLKSGGWLLLEHGYDQATAVRDQFTSAGWRDVRSWKDLAGIERISGGRWGAIMSEK
jgi:release factor glutamine methyltransferase